MARECEPPSSVLHTIEDSHAETRSSRSRAYPPRTPRLRVIHFLRELCRRHLGGPHSRAMTLRPCLRLVVLFHLAPAHAEDDALRLVQRGHLLRAQPQEQPAQDAREGAVAHREGVALEASRPALGAVRDVGIGFAAGYAHVPLVVLALVEELGIEGACLLVREAVPFAQVDLLDALVGLEALGRQAQMLADDLHRQARAVQRAR